MPRPLSLRYLLFKTLLIPIIRVLSPRAQHVMWCDVLVFWAAPIFCNNFARWLQKIAACWCVGFLGCSYLFNHFARWLQKIVACDVMQSTESPIFDALFGHKTGFRAGMNEIKIGDSVLWCNVLVFWDAMIFFNNFARWLQKIVACWCLGFLGVGFLGVGFWELVSGSWFLGVGFWELIFWDAMIFCNNFARW